MFGPTITEGHEELNGLLPPAIKFDGDGGRPNELTISGAQKSSISLFSIIPVLDEASKEPNLKIRKEKILKLFQQREVKMFYAENERAST